VREYPSEASLARINQPNFANQTGGPKDYRNGINPGRSMRQTLENFAKNPGRNQRNFWLLGPDPYPNAHFATFVREIPKRAILAGCPHKCCAECGAPWVRVVERERIKESDSPRYAGVSMRNDANDGRYRHSRNTVDWEPACTCNGETRPGIVLDPFMGSGTTAAVARSLGRELGIIDEEPVRRGGD
jgi:hypothetical protein